MSGGLALDNTPVISGFPKMMHDGSAHDGFHYWTTVDGKIFRAGEKALELELVADFTKLYGRSEPGWCRGLEILGDVAFVGFTRFRKPSKREFAMFAIRGAKVHNTHLLCYNLKEQRVVEDYYLPEADSIIYGVYRYRPEV